MTPWDRASADLAVIVRVFHWPPSELEALTFDELADWADLARMDQGL